MSLSEMYNQKLSSGSTEAKSSQKIVSFPLAEHQTIDANDTDLAQARNLFISTVLKRVNDFANLDQTIVASDIKYFESRPDEDKRIYFNRLSFAVSFFAILEAHIVSVPEFRRFFINVVTQEISLDKLPSDDVKAIRSSLRVSKYDVGDTYYIYGKQKTTPEAYRSLAKTLEASYELLNGAEKDMLEDARKLTAEERRELGIVCSHFGYILRAMAYNDKFMIACASAVDHFLEINDR